MSGEDIELMLRKHDETLDRIEKQHEQNERLAAAILKSQDRFEKGLARHDDVLAVMQAQMSEVNKTIARHTTVFERNERRYEQFLEAFNLFMQELIGMKQWSGKTNGRLDRIEDNLERAGEKLDRLAEAQIKTDEQIRALAASVRDRKQNSIDS